MTEAANEGLKHGEKVYSEREVKAMKEQIAMLEKTLGRKTVKIEILEEVVRIGIEKKLLSSMNWRPTSYPSCEVVDDSNRKRYSSIETTHVAKISSWP